ncbi:MAG: DUF4276 family protein [Anaerolineae bacterium]
MATLKLGFALEGNSDYPIIPLLSRRVVQDTFPDVTIAPDSILRPRKRGHGFIRELSIFARQLREDNVDVVIAVVDTDNTRINERLKLLYVAKDQCARLEIAVCIAEGLAVCSVEAWMLADPQAIFNVFDGDQASVSFPAPEDNPSPKRALNDIVRTLTKGRQVTFVPFADVLAADIQLSVLRHRCDHFDKFARNLTNCVKEWQRIGQSTIIV